MTNGEPGRHELCWWALEDLDAARTGLEAVSGLAWLSELDAADTAGLIRRTYEVFPELDRVVSQQVLAARVAVAAESQEQPLDDRVFLLLLARTIDPSVGALTEKAVELAAQAHAWEVVGALVDGAPASEEQACAGFEAHTGDGLTGAASLISHFSRYPSASLWRVSEELGEAIDRSAPVGPGTRVAQEPWHTAAVFVQGRELIEAGNLQSPRGRYATANLAAVVARARRSLDAVLPREALYDPSRRWGRKRITGAVRWADLICERETASIPARLLQSQDGRRDEAGSICTDRPVSGRLAFGPYCTLVPGHYTATLTGSMSGRCTLRFAVACANQTFGMVSAVVERSEAQPGTRDLATCSFILSEFAHDIEFTVATIAVSGTLVIASVDLRRVPD